MNVNHSRPFLLCLIKLNTCYPFHIDSLLGLHLSHALITNGLNAQRQQQTWHKAQQ